MAGKNRKKKGKAERMLISAALIICAVVIGMLAKQKEIPSVSYDIGSTASERILETASLQELLFENKLAKININTATLEQLQKLEGIGESKARAIIEYRQANGGFTKPEDLLNVNGIGKNILENIKDRIEF